MERFNNDESAPSSVMAVADLARRAGTVERKIHQGPYKDAAPFVILVDSTGAEHVTYLKDKVDAPTRKNGTVLVRDAASFIKLFKVHGVEQGPVYADLTPAKFVAVLNDNVRSTSDNPGANWRDHRIDFLVAHSPEWMAWKKHDGAGAAFNGTDAFACFIEENSPDFDKPDAAAMLSIAKNFRIKQGVVFNQAIRLEDGDVDLTYQNTVQAGSGANGKIKIPTEFRIKLRVWDGPFAKTYPVEARFRYRLEGQRLSLWYELVRPHKVIEAAFKDLWTEIEGATKSTMIYGSPESK